MFYHYLIYSHIHTLQGFGFVAKSLWYGWVSLRNIGNQVVSLFTLQFCLALTGSWWPDKENINKYWTKFWDIGSLRFVLKKPYPCPHAQNSSRIPLSCFQFLLRVTTVLSPPIQMAKHDYHILALTVDKFYKRFFSLIHALIIFRANNTWWIIFLMNKSQ